MSQAYGVLDKYKISKTFFVKTDQADCAHLEVDTRITEKPVTQKPQNSQTSESNVKSVIAQNDADIQEREETEAGISAEKASLDAPKIIADESVKIEQSVETVPERILKIAETIKEEDDVHAKTIIVEVKEDIAEESAKEKSDYPSETEKKTV